RRSSSVCLLLRVDQRRAVEPRHKPETAITDGSPPGGRVRPVIHRNRLDRLRQVRTLAPRYHRVVDPLTGYPPAGLNQHPAGTGTHMPQRPVRIGSGPDLQPPLTVPVPDLPCAGHDFLESLEPG